MGSARDLDDLLGGPDDSSDFTRMVRAWRPDRGEREPAEMLVRFSNAWHDAFLIELSHVPEEDRAELVDAKGKRVAWAIPLGVDSSGCPVFASSPPVWAPSFRLRRRDATLSRWRLLSALDERRYPPPPTVARLIGRWVGRRSAALRRTSRR
jgi:hypothetical protein